MLGKKDYWKVALTFIIALGICLTALAELEKPIPVLPTPTATTDGTMSDAENDRAVQQLLQYKDEAANTPQYNGINGIKGSAQTILANPNAAPEDYSDRAVFFTENFEDEAVSTPDDPFPVTGWTRITTVTGYTWFVETPSGGSGPIGTVSALCPYGPVGSPQDEWIITPAIDVSAATSDLYVEFAYLHDNLNYPFELDLYVSTTGTSTGDFTLLWQASGESHPNMEFTTTSVDLSAYAGESNLYLAWRYQGEDANLGGIDDIVVADALPTGRCCYGDPEAPDCIDGVTQTECTDTYSGTWTVDLNCTDDPCPVAPANDLCTTAEHLGGSFPVTVSGDNTGATPDCPGELDWQNGVWYSFDLPYAVNNVNIDFCGSPTMSTISAILFTACSCDEADFIYYSGGEFYDCGDGWDVPSVDWQGVPGPATIYYAVDFDVPGPFTFTVNVEELIPPDNDDADKAEEIGEVTDLPFSTTLATFDGPGGCQTAPNVWFCYTPTGTGLATIELCGSGYDTKMAVYDGCEVDVDGNPLGAELACNDDDYDVCPSRVLQSAVQLEVTAGNTYLIEVGGYSSNVGEGDITTSVVVGGVCCDPATGDCTDVPDEATCTAAGGNFHAGETCADYTCPPPPSPGDNCDEPLKIDIPGDLPYSDVDNYTCGRFNNYPADDMCYTLYGDGEDVVYEVTVGAATTVELTMDPQGTGWWYCQISENCPPVTEDCVYYFRSSSGDPMTSDPVALSAGTYYILIDTWPSPDCIPSYTLSIDEYEDCEVTCPSGAVSEAEPCGDDTNGGCGADPPTEEFEAITPGTTVCGTSWVDPVGGMRDTDWYEFTTTESGYISWSGVGEFPFLMFVIDGTGGCGAYEALLSGEAEPCDTVDLEVYVPAGTYWLWAGSSSFDADVQCGGTGTYGEDYVATFEFTPAQDYCSASGGCDEYIENVTVGTINNTTGCDQYGDYTSLSTDMEPGGSYPITITLGGAWSSDIGAVWIDWNADFDFDDAGEAITLDVFTGYGPYTGTINVPSDAALGETRMRVRLNYYTAPGPCGVTSYGEVEDYTVNIASGEVEPHMIIVPDTMYYSDGYLIEDEIVTIYMGGNDIGFDMNDVDQGTVQVNGLTPSGMSIGTHPDMTGDVLVIELSKIAFVQNYGVIWSDIDYTYDCTGDHSGGSFNEVGDLELIGHIPGDVNLDRTVNILDIMYMIDFKYNGGPEVDPVEVGDVNASGEFNVLDMLYLIDYKYKNGPAPQHP